MNNINIEIQQLMDLKIHDIVKVRDGMQVIRVPGGWIYYAQTDINTTPSETFVQEPIEINYDKEYLKTRNKEEILKFLTAIFFSLTLFLLGLLTKNIWN